MSGARLTAAFLVSALIRRVHGEGGFAAVIRRGDPQAGAILIDCRARGAADMLLERASTIDGTESWRVIGVADEPVEQRQARLDQRIRHDPDLWIVELDIVDAERFAAETIAAA